MNRERSVPTRKKLGKLGGLPAKFKIIILISMCFISNVYAEDRIRLYATEDGYPKRIGYAIVQNDGSIRYYTNIGEYKGRSKDEYIFSKDGRLIEKIYTQKNH